MPNQEKWKQVRSSIINSEDYPSELWYLVEEFAEDFLVKGRPDFDVPHTHGVVYWAYTLATAFNKQIEIGEIRDEEPIDIVVLVTAAWLHDIGYYGQFDEVADYSAVYDKKAMHMVVGAKMARDFLESLVVQFLTVSQIEQVVHLITVHDDLDKIVTLLETMLVESDTLGMMDIEWVEPTYQGVEALDFPDRPRAQKRFQIFKTKLGTSSLREVIERFKEFIIDRDFDGEDPRV
jgi:hypothetical protein